jgi:predicted chitinase
MAVSLTQLLECMPHLPLSRAQGYLVPLQAAMTEFEISFTTRRAAAFLAQIGHESADLKHWSEKWGPTDAQKRYEGRKDLGNVHTGDGFKFRGRGPIQLTGRANYERYGELLGIDLIADPSLAASPRGGFRIAGLFWREHGLNALADANQFEQITRRINGGTNGADDRSRRYKRCLAVLG